jgi:nitrogen fixation NifU-like protein
MDSEEEIYQEHVLDHYEDPYHCGAFPDKTHQAEGKNPLCGDRVTIQLKIGADQRIEDAWFEGSGCCISQASASMLVEAIEGKSVVDVMKMSAEEMLHLFGPRLTPNRQKCCLLPWRVAQIAVHQPVSSVKEKGEG